MSFNNIKPIEKTIELKKEIYFEVYRLKKSIIYRRSVSDEIYLKYLLQALKVDELKDICRENKIKGFSSENKSGLIEMISLNLSEEEIREYLIENEQDIIWRSISMALQMISGKTQKEKIKELRCVNIQEQELELTTEGSNWDIHATFTINKDNTSDPTRYCDCNFGKSGGFCVHFWVLFIKALKHNFLKIQEWNLTFLPSNFSQMIQQLKS